MSEFTSETLAPRSPAAGLANGLDLSEAVTGAEAELDERKQLRREADKAQLHLALRDLAEGLRRMIRVAPFASVATAVAVGLLLGRRRRRPPMRRV